VGQKTLFADEPQVHDYPDEKALQIWRIAFQPESDLTFITAGNRSYLFGSQALRSELGRYATDGSKMHVSHGQIITLIPTDQIPKFKQAYHENAGEKEKLWKLLVTRRALALAIIGYRRRTEALRPKWIAEDRLNELAACVCPPSPEPSEAERESMLLEMAKLAE